MRARPANFVMSSFEGRRGVIFFISFIVFCLFVCFPFFIFSCPPTSNHRLLDWLTDVLIDHGNDRSVDGPSVATCIERASDIDHYVSHHLEESFSVCFLLVCFFVG